MPYWRLFYHFVWTTRERLPLISEPVEQEVYALARKKAEELGGVVLALGGITDHIHLVASAPPRLSPAEFIGQIKGFTAMTFNKSHQGEDVLFWQNEYGVFSFSKASLPKLISYVKRQKEHHQEGSLMAALERTSD